MRYSLLTKAPFVLEHHKFIQVPYDHALLIKAQFSLDHHTLI